MAISIVQRPPLKCSEIEIDAFERLVKEGGEVNPNGLRGRIRSAYSLVWLQGTDGTLVGVGAIKQPNEHYRSLVFMKAGSGEDPSNYEAELGWIFLRAEFRGQGLSSSLIKKLLSVARGKAIYATIRENNEAMVPFSRNLSSYKKAGLIPQMKAITIWCCISRWPHNRVELTSGTLTRFPQFTWALAS